MQKLFTDPRFYNSEEESVSTNETSLFFDVAFDNRLYI